MNLVSYIYIYIYNIMLFFKIFYKMCYLLKKLTMLKIKNKTFYNIINELLVIDSTSPHNISMRSCIDNFIHTHTSLESSILSSRQIYFCPYNLSMFNFHPCSIRFHNVTSIIFFLNSNL